MGSDALWTGGRFAAAGERLLERGGELDSLARALAEARAGAGRMLALEGAGGIGKTSLLGMLRREAIAADLSVLHATGTELERELGYGVVVQLFERRLNCAATAERASLLAGPAALAQRALGLETASGDHRNELHGLYWLVANLAEQGGPAPLVLMIDDAQWADQQSLRFLNYLAGRLAGLRVLVVLATRPASPPLLEALLARSTCEGLRLAPLSRMAARMVISQRLGGEIRADLADACHQATDGNPYLLNELAATLSSPNATVAEVHAQAPPSVTRSAMVRLASLGSAATQVAQALAILGGANSLTTIAALAEVDIDCARNACDALMGDEIAVQDDDHRLRHAHTLLAAAIIAGLTASRRAALHGRAARVLAGEREDPERVALHLRNTEPGGDAWVVAQLRAAAERATIRGAPEIAYAHLGRALREPPAEAAARGEVLAALARAGAVAGRPEAAGDLRRAIDASPDASARGHLALDLARVLSVRGSDPVEARTALEDALRDLNDGELRLRLEAQLVALTRYAADTAGRARAHLERLAPTLAAPESPGRRLVLTHLALESALAGDDVARTIRLAQQGLGSGALIREEGADSPVCYVGIHALVAADEFAEAERHLQCALSDARERGSALGFASASMCRSHSLCARGMVSEAAADARGALALAVEHGYDQMVPWMIGFLVEALIEIGDLDEAEGVLERIDSTAWPLVAAGLSPLLVARGRLHAARKDHRAALADFMTAGRERERIAAPNPAMSAWRSHAATSLAALGEHDRARLLADTELVLARVYGAARPIAVALRGRALAEPATSAGLERLRQASAMLEHSPARLEHARTLVELGTMLRLLRRPADARGPLYDGLKQARRAGASALVERAHDELAATGVKLRKIIRGGPGGLTPSELRVARLAADDLTNAQIAQTLFVTPKTVEAHLGHVYKKLDIDSRHKLAGILAGYQSGVDEAA
ncbi:MAG: hypothetical protein QOH12_2742 [Solirubrobacteraceae bacterium]|nr:hypothetical protein [Solirubrobacteraceae bacterium]